MLVNDVQVFWLTLAPAAAATAPFCRFDIVLLLLDQHEPTWDTIVSDHVLTTHQQVSPG
jgi:hypothetical protein